MPVTAFGTTRRFGWAIDVGWDLFVYHYPARTTTELTPAQLVTIQSVVGAKISGLPVDRVREYIAAAPGGFTVYSGNDVEFGAVVRAGGAGAVSGVSSAFPEPVVTLRDALRHGLEAAAADAQRQVEQVVAAVGGNAALIKAALALRDLPAGPTRVALDPPMSVQREAIAAAVVTVA